MARRSSYIPYAGRQVDSADLDAATISVFTERTRRIDIYHAQCSPTSTHHRSHRQGTVPYGVWWPWTEVRVVNIGPHSAQPSETSPPVLYTCLFLRGCARLACLCLLARNRVAQQEGGEREGRGDAFTLLQHPRVPQEDYRPGGTCRPEVRVGTRVNGEGEGEG